MPTDITSLAPETLGRIFQFGAEDEAAKAPFLLATSLVCRAWRHESQARLWHTISFVSKETLDAPPANIRVVDSPALGRFVTVHAEFWGPTKAGPMFPSGKEISKIIKSLRGLQNLIIRCAENIPATTFLGANLSDLSSLIFIHTKIIDFLNITAIPFRLKSLNLIADGGAPNFVQSVLAASHLQKIIIFLPQWSDELKHLLRILPAHSADLEDVQLLFGYGEWNPKVFATCPSLRRLTFFGYPEPENFKAILAEIPSSLHHFAISGSPDQDRHRELIVIILEYLAKPVFGSLRSLTLPESITNQTWIKKTGFMTECDARGIEVINWKPTRS